MGFAAQQAQQLFKQIRIGLQYLHGRHVSNIFDRCLCELEANLADLMNGHYLNELLEESDFGKDVHLPDFEKTSPHKLRYIWDYFIFLYMSHKIQNIKRRDRSYPLPTMVYLRGSDYEFAATRERAALGYAMTLDQQFQSSILHPFKGYFNVVKALSPTDLTWIMMDIGGYLIVCGNTLSNVAEFGRMRDEGIFLNSNSWKDTIGQLFPSSSVFLVYVSNQSQGLKFELQSLLSLRLEQNSILILDNRRFGGRQSFFEVQESLRDGLYSSVIRDACAVDNPDEFESLLEKFPFKLEMTREVIDPDPSTLIRSNLRKTNHVEFPVESAAQPPAASELKRQEFLQDLVSLIQKALRNPERAPSEIPFEFKIHLSPETRAKFDEFRQYVADQIDKSLTRDCPSNWPAVLLFIELDVFLCLISGEVCRAAQSMARYAAIADFVCAFVRRSQSEESIRLGNTLEQYGNMAMNVAVDALSLGEWNDYSDRRTLAREHVRTLEHEMHSALSLSVASASSVKLKACRPKTVIEDESTIEAGVKLQKQMLDAAIDKVQGSDLTLVDLHNFHRKE
jgi:hypothetical protein